MSQPAKKHVGSCHCQDVRFEVEVDATAGSRCNCSICTKIAQLGAIVKPDALVVLSDPDKLGQYAWGGKVSTRFFCKRCGVHCFSRGHLAELGGDFAGVNLNCLDDVDPSTVEVTYWDGRHDNWQAGARTAPWPISPR
jgi:hypothetical protein